MEGRPAPDPAKLLAQWMEWERGDVTPGRVIANLKTGGLRILLEGLAAAAALDAPAGEAVTVAADGAAGAPPDEAAAAAWTPVV